MKSEDFIKKARAVHGDKYDYSKVEYVNNRTKVCIICPIHGEFWQTPICHLKGNICPKCSKNKKPTTEEFIQKAKEVYGEKYDYSKVEYINNSTKVCIICPEHGEFLQSSTKHFMGQGCPKCNESKLERKIALLLEKEEIEFEIEKKFYWLGRQRLDFYLPKYKAAIECQGEQHFQPIKYFGGIDKLVIYQKRDETKKLLCQQNKINLIYINYFDSEEEINNKLNEVFNGKTKL